MKEIVEEDLKNEDSNPPSKKYSEDITNETIEKPWRGRKSFKKENKSD
jgi:hypothetical protein